MRGTVEFKRFDMLVVRLDDGCYAVIETLGHDVEIGDELSGRLTAEGDALITHVSEEEKFDAIVQKVCRSKQEALNLI